jgi:hypothetical protein
MHQIKYVIYENPSDCVSEHPLRFVGLSSDVFLFRFNWKCSMSESNLSVCGPHAVPNGVYQCVPSRLLLDCDLTPFGCRG